MFRIRRFGRLTRGLRFRLTATYAVFFALILIGVAALFRQRLANTLDAQAHDGLEQRWAAMKGFLRIERSSATGRNEAFWYYDDKDADESRTVLAIKAVYLITDQDGAVIPDHMSKSRAVSQTYAAIGIDSADSIRARVAQAVAAAKPDSPGMEFWSVRTGPGGVNYLIRSGVVYDESHVAAVRHEPHYVALGFSLANEEKTVRDFSLFYLVVIPCALIVGSLLGWIVAGRALAPVRAVAQTAQRISGSNLSLRIPSSQAGDELDYLILTFNRMIDRLESSFQQIKQFSTDVSHELRTPITAIRGQLEVALFTAQTAEQYREAMFNALQDIDRLSQIVRALLLLSQAESGQLILQKAKLDLSDTLRDLVDQFQIPAEAAAVRLTADLEECPIMADRVQIERLVTNLLSNALKFTPEGGLVHVSLRVAGAEAEMIVEDTGQGIPPEHLPHIFERFYRVPTPGSAPPEQGLGLGLSFVAWIVKAHDGTIAVESEPGKGTRFAIRLPALGATPEQAGAGTIPGGRT